MNHNFGDSEKKKQLSSDEKFLVTNLLLLTGRENTLKRESIVQHSKLLEIRTAVPLLRDSHGINDAVERCNLLNRLLVSLDVKPAEREFLELVFGNVDFTKNDDVAERVKKFRCLCMLEYGSFLNGYENLKVGFGVRRGKSLRDLWIRHYPSASEICERVKRYEEKAGI